MNPTQNAVLILALGTLLAGVPGCMEQIALFPRPTLPETEPDVIGAVERVDIGAHRLYLRSNSGERSSVAFTDDAQVFDRGREFPITRLAPDDVVALRIKRDARGESYVDLIRLQVAARADRGLQEETMPAPHIETLSGTVQRVNRRDDSFELENSPNKMISVALSQYVRDSDRELFQKLRSGDHVRIEGRFIGRERFEMLSFLNDQY
jgi:hypothetical protein